MQQRTTSERRWGDKTIEERRSIRRSSLMKAAIATYGASGFRNTSVKSVCAAAGLTERYFYESFTGSEDLLQACFREVTRDLLAKVREAALRPGPPDERVRAGLRVYYGELRKTPTSARVFLIEIASVSQAIDALVAESLDAFGSLLLDALEGTKGRPAPSPLLLRGVVGGGLHIAQAWINSGYAAPIAEVIEAAMRIYCLAKA